ncbi:MAG: glutamate-1-semialdehyde 2,1-aminomutase [Bdellovibrionales bacterium]|nr:glutamate-1-semialdehyde 2,1-aminomutase [Bdellovibrionales bacterium]
MQNSQALFERSLQVAPGGVHSPVRAFRSVGGTPVFFARAQGPYLYSVEGDRYIDFCQSFGPNILGHRDPDVEHVLKQTIELGWCFGACEPYSLELAELVKAELPWVERLRFVCSGTEAVMSALRVARAATGRPSILKFEGCYHGHADSLLVKAGSGLAGPSASDSAGVPEFLAAQTLTCPLDDEAALEHVFKNHGSQIAAVIIEPMPANYGLLLQRPEYLQRVAEMARANGSLLILDEVISGFRVAFGGMVERTGIRPDLVTYGKVMGGGLAVGAYAGRADLMDLVAPAGKVYQAGTLSANPLAMRTGWATLNKLKTFRVHSVLEERMQDFAAELKKVLQPAGLTVTHFSSVFWIHPQTGKPLRSLTDLPAGMGDRYKSFFHALLKRGVYMAPSGYEVGFLSLAHETPVLDEALGKIREAVRDIG